jgi:hypothetical protein
LNSADERALMSAGTPRSVTHFVHCFAFVLALIICGPPSAARAAKIVAVTTTPQGSVIIIDGDLEVGDEKRFIDVALPLTNAVVVLQSNGGNLIAGIEIGKAIRLKGFTTLVPADVQCSSAALWLGSAGKLAP